MSPVTPSNASQVHSFSVEIDSGEEIGLASEKLKPVCSSISSLRIKCSEWENNSIPPRVSVTVYSGRCCSVGVVHKSLT